MENKITSLYVRRTSSKFPAEEKCYIHSQSEYTLLIEWDGDFHNVDTRRIKNGVVDEDDLTPVVL